MQKHLDPYMKDYVKLWVLIKMEVTRSIVKLGKESSIFSVSHSSLDFIVSVEIEETPEKSGVLSEVLKSQSDKINSSTFCKQW